MPTLSLESLIQCDKELLSSKAAGLPRVIRRILADMYGNRRLVLARSSI